MLIYSESDEDLMELVKTQSPGAFEEIIRRYSNRLLARTFRQIENHDIAEDIVQDTLTAVCEESDKYDKNIAKFSTWIYTILKNQIDKYLRDSRKSREMVSLSNVEEDKDEFLIISQPLSGFENLSESKLLKIRDIVRQYFDDDEKILYEFKEERGFSYEQIHRQRKFRRVSIPALKKRRERYLEKIIEILEIEKYNK
jgi:RNA polymerase sigma factor (sigma-70 family)